MLNAAKDAQFQPTKHLNSNISLACLYKGMHQTSNMVKCCLTYRVTKDFAVEIDPIVGDILSR